MLDDGGDKFLPIIVQSPRWMTAEREVGIGAEFS
jgi:hypothetical protein